MWCHNNKTTWGNNKNMMYLFYCKSFVSASQMVWICVALGNQWNHTPLKKSAYQTLAKTLSEPPWLKGGEWRCTGAEEVISNSTSLELGAGALRPIWTPRWDPNEIQWEGKGVFSLCQDKWGVTLQKPQLHSLECNMYEKSFKSSEIFYFLHSWVIQNTFMLP